MLILRIINNYVIIKYYKYIKQLRGEKSVTAIDYQISHDKRSVKKG